MWFKCSTITLERIQTPSVFAHWWDLNLKFPLFTTNNQLWLCAKRNQNSRNLSFPEVVGPCVVAAVSWLRCVQLRQVHWLDNDRLEATFVRVGLRRERRVLLVAVLHMAFKAFLYKWVFNTTPQQKHPQQSLTEATIRPVQSEVIQPMVINYKQNYKQTKRLLKKNETLQNCSSITRWRHALVSTWVWDAEAKGCVTSSHCWMEQRGISAVPIMVSQIKPLFHSSTTRPDSRWLISLQKHANTWSYYRHSKLKRCSTAVTSAVLQTHSGSDVRSFSLKNTTEHH